MDDIDASNLWESKKYSNGFTCEIWMVKLHNRYMDKTKQTYSLLSFSGHFIVESQRLKVILGAAVLENDHTNKYIGEKLTEMVEYKQQIVSYYVW